MTPKKTANSLLWLAVTLAIPSSTGTAGVLVSGPTEGPHRMWDPTSLDLMNATNQTVQVGSTAFLHCQVLNLADKKVSWIRRRDYHVLTSGLIPYAQDERFSVVRAEDSDDWALQIKFVQERDAGAYECQVSTKVGSYGYVVNLEVVVPVATIRGSKELHVQSGSTISLLCVVEKGLTPPHYVFWFHNRKMINYDQSRGGISVVTDHTTKTTSRLTISDAKDTDSGQYSCNASNTQPSTVTVFVTEGDKPAAIQRFGSSCQGVYMINSQHHHLLLLLFSLIPIVLFLLHDTASHLLS
ncbi:opioid-binding protein/cell adhesion molecule-like isoform X2 [Oratosquilla oratoria]|uniref:opioid-binding protein/cell adhesion molecule-like isoform X2 n=1 Tax=Oratosquilla oratoria TaxID=337810 RepID=UPI003F75F2D2